MTMLYLLDTDHISLLQRGHPTASAKYRLMKDEAVFVSVVSYEEQLRGRLAVVSQSKTPESLLMAYYRLGEMQEYFCRFRMLGFTDVEHAIFVVLRQKHRRQGKMDLRIAATALANDAILVTRNTQDFIDIENLTLENWA